MWQPGGGSLIRFALTEVQGGVAPDDRSAQDKVTCAASSFPAHCQSVLLIIHGYWSDMFCSGGGGASVAQHWQEEQTGVNMGRHGPADGREHEQMEKLSTSEPPRSLGTQPDGFLLWHR